MGSVSTYTNFPGKIAMVLETSDYLSLLDAYQLNLFNQKFQNSLTKTILQGNGRIIEVNDAACRAIFPSASSAIFAAHKVHDDFKYVIPKVIKNTRRLNVALSVLPKDHTRIETADIFEDLTRLCEYLRFDFIITREVRRAFRLENRHAVIDEDLIYVLSDREDKFFSSLMEHMERNWSKTSFSREELASATGYSISQCNRKVKKMTGKTPFAFLKEYRLRKALKSLHDSRDRIGKIARNHGFKSGTHFSKSFHETFGILPSKYVQWSG